VKIPKEFTENDLKGYLYFIRIGDANNRKYKVGTACNIIQRMLQHCRDYKEQIYILWISPIYTKYTILRLEDKTKIKWKRKKAFEHVPNDRFIIPKSYQSVIIKVKKEYLIILE
jgi:hypothetical protein